MSTPIPSLGNKTPEQLRVAELREELKKRGINIKGLKKDLVERLDEILRQEAAEAAADNETKKSPSPERVSDRDEETPASPAVVFEAVTQPPGEEDTAGKVVDLSLDVVELEPSSEPLHGGDDLKTGIVDPTLSVPVPEEDGLSKGKGTEMATSLVAFAEPEVVTKGEPVFVGPVRALTAESISSPKLDELPSREPESAPPVEVTDESNKTFVDEGKLEFEDTRDENLDSGKLIEADGVVEAEPEAIKFPEVEVQDEAEQLKSHYGSGPTSSTDAVIIEASEAEEVRTETAVLSEGLRSTAYGERDAEEESVVAETGGDLMTTETVTVETVSVVTETTVVTTETVVVNEIEADLSTVEGDREGSFTQRSSDAGTLSNEGRVAEEALLQNRDQDEGMEVEQDKAKDSKPMEIDSDSVTGVKRKDGEELRQQEPAKRQRRWNSDKSLGASADVTAPPQVNTTDTLKEAVAPAARDIPQKPVAPSPSTTSSSTPKASAASTSFDKPAPSRTILSRTDIAVNGDADKKRVVPPPTRSPTVALKIDRFVRPFTIKAVKELLQQTGTVKQMWMDQIKTHCFVTYSSVEEATATRNSLYHLQWPVAGGKLLIAEFVEPEEVMARVEGTNDKPVPTPVTTPRGSANSSTQVAGAMGITPPAAHIPTSALPPPPPLPPPPRERPALPPKKEPEAIPTLDDLFKKTRTKPQIYFLPLTDEQVADNVRNKQPVGKAPVKA